MGEIFDYGEKDQDKLTYFILLLVGVGSMVFVNYFEVFDLLQTTIIKSNSALIPDLILTLFPYWCRYPSILHNLCFDDNG